MPRPKGAPNRVLPAIEDRGGRGRSRYRVHYVVDRRRLHECFATEGAAKEYQAQLREQFAQVVDAGPPLGQLIESWFADREKRGQVVYPYMRLYTPRVLEHVLDDPAGVLDGPALREGYEALAATLAGATNRLVLTCLRQFCDWLVREGKLATNPARALKPIGKVNRGKAQIETARELLAFRDEAWRLANAGDLGALAVLLGLYLGLRSGEVRALEARHVDLGQMLVVPGTKTQNSRRVLPVVVSELWALLERRARDAAGAPLVPLGWQALVARVKTIARTAGVVNAESLTFHSLRGMAASLSARSGAAFEAIASALGHGGTGVTRAHYISSTSNEIAEQRQRVGVLDRPVNGPN